ncbi:pyridoxal phosphate-dependent aminotransferase [Thermus thermamylovorans]|uniref:Aminotransferase class I/II-fold pyridoxal phosphate-dependent enzyme n=1 Tax=Thermus thermamylovorans TaxID=2509362 RepID=A0A4V2IVA0_9DEIN|nr:aminotransferase class I/II-fold pyridoxal phosphate-dependent enzyme [Thermus thermamylovorans]TBH21505.1 aminotransferase class I/II-fold pyridoxal phosphate-dependent enzyme [Thermus thermamylovorans]
MRLHPRTRAARESIFPRMSGLALRLGAVNLGQGFPSGPPPPFLLEAVRKALGRHDQYAPPAGLPPLREALAEEFAVDPEGVVVTSGATEALYVLLQSLVGPGDEVVVLEPFFDVYLPDAFLAGAEARLVRLELGERGFHLDLAALEGAIGERTRVLLLNAPMNPTGLVFREEALRRVADLAQRHDLFLVSDEVYDELYYGERPRRLREFAPERTFTVGSAGKRLEATGYRVGWIVGPKEYMPTLAGMRQWTSFSSPSPLQAGVAEALRVARKEGFYEALREDYRRRRDLLLSGLRSMGLKAYGPEGTYFLMAELPGWDPFALLEAARVALIPASAFYREDPPPFLFRFAFCKSEEELYLALERLAAVVNFPREAQTGGLPE